MENLEMIQETPVRCYIAGNNIIKFDDVIDVRSISCLMDCILTLIESENFDGELILYMNSGGGVLGDSMDFIDFMLNQLPQDVNVIFKINGDAYSGMCFIILQLWEHFQFDISDYAHLMLHVPNRDMKIRNNSHIKTDEANCINYMNDIIDQYLIPAGFLYKDIQALRNKEDVYWTGRDFKMFMEVFNEIKHQENLETLLDELESNKVEIENRIEFVKENLK